MFKNSFISFFHSGISMQAVGLFEFWPGTRHFGFCIGGQRCDHELVGGSTTEESPQGVGHKYGFVQPPSVSILGAIGPVKSETAMANQEVFGGGPASSS